MPTLLQINVTANWGSTGKIAEAIGQSAMKQRIEFVHSIWTKDDHFQEQSCKSRLKDG